MNPKPEVLAYARKITRRLLVEDVPGANDLFREMLSKFPLCKWEQIAFSDIVRGYRKDGIPKVEADTDD